MATSPPRNGTVTAEEAEAAAPTPNEHRHWWPPWANSALLIATIFGGVGWALNSASKASAQEVKIDAAVVKVDKADATASANATAIAVNARDVVAMKAATELVVTDLKGGQGRLETKLGEVVTEQTAIKLSSQRQELLLRQVLQKLNIALAADEPKPR